MVLSVAVRGVPGSGKTWLCQRLTESGIVCYDTDDVMIENFNRLIKTKKFRELVKSGGEPWRDYLHESSQNRLIKMIEKSTRKGIPVVIVGVTIDLSKWVDKCYFIKMSETQLRKAYRNLLLREFEKVLSKTPEEIVNVINSNDVELIGAILQMWLNQAVKLTLKWHTYVKMYEDGLKGEEGKCEVMSQTEILKEIRRTFC